MEELKTARAQLVHARIAPRKVQIVCDMIRGKDTKVAEAYMANTPKAVSSQAKTCCKLQTNIIQ